MGAPHSKIARLRLRIGVRLVLASQCTDTDGQHTTLEGLSCQYRSNSKFKIQVQIQISKEEDERPPSREISGHVLALLLPLCSLKVHFCVRYCILALGSSIFCLTAWSTVVR